MLYFSRVFNLIYLFFRCNDAKNGQLALCDRNANCFFNKDDLTHSCRCKRGTLISKYQSGPENLKKSRPKNSWNEMNQFHGIFFLIFSIFLKVIFTENIQNKFFRERWNWFIWFHQSRLGFHEFFWPTVNISAVCLFFQIFHEFEVCLHFLNFFFTGYHNYTGSGEVDDCYDKCFNEDKSDFCRNEGICLKVSEKKIII